MPVAPSDFKSHADRVDDTHNDEIARRSSISRKYYYIFHRVREENDGHAKSHFTYRGGDHQEVSKFLERIGHKNLSDLYDNLRSKRNEADYDIDKSIGSFKYQMFLADLDDFEREAKQECVIQ
jgi:uncharacterized protein (UPF0332 family)